jgi:hypothetical protein
MITDNTGLFRNAQRSISVLCVIPDYRLKGIHSLDMLNCYLRRITLVDVQLTPLYRANDPLHGWQGRIGYGAWFHGLCPSVTFT